MRIGKELGTIQSSEKNLPVNIVTQSIEEVAQQSKEEIAGSLRSHFRRTRNPEVRGRDEIEKHTRSFDSKMKENLLQINH